MKCNEFFTMSAELPLRENEMSSRKVVGQDSIDLRRMALFALYFRCIVLPGWISVGSDFVVGGFWHGSGL